MNRTESSTYEERKRDTKISPNIDSTKVVKQRENQQM